MAKHRRRRQLIKPGSQLRIVAYAVLVALVALLLNLSLLVFGIESSFSAAASVDTQIQDSIRSAVLKYSLFSAGLVVPLATCLGIVISFQIFGPIYRFERFITLVAGGDLSEDCRLRRGDDLGDLEHLINLMVARMRDDFHRDREAFAEVLDGLDEFEPLLPDSLRMRAETIRKLAREAIEAGPRLGPEPQAEPAPEAEAAPDAQKRPVDTTAP